MNKIPPQIKAETLRPMLFHSFSCCLCLKGQHKMGSPLKIFFFIVFTPFFFPVIPFGGFTSLPANLLARLLAARFACQKRRVCSQSKEVANNWDIVLLIAMILHICRAVLDFT